MSKTDLEKSHSKASNFKLTLICLLLALAVSVFWVGVIFVFTDINYILTSSLIIGGAVLSILSFLLVGKFTR